MCADDHSLLPYLSTVRPSSPTESHLSTRGVTHHAVFAVRRVRVFDGDRVLSERDVLIRDGLIVEIEQSLRLPDEVEAVDGRGKTLLPGLIDAHVHTWEEARRAALRFGVTTELDMFCDWRSLADAKRERESLEPVDKADLWSAGTLATIARGHGTQFGLAIPTLASPVQAAEWVAGRTEEGSDYIKIVREDRRTYGGAALPTLDSATSAAIVEAAHARSRIAVVHVSAQDFASDMLESGIDGFAHVFHDRVADRAFVASARDRGIFVIPTLTLIAGMSGEANGVQKDTALSSRLEVSQRLHLTRRAPASEARRPLIANARDSVRRLHDAGVPILAGTDAPNRNTVHGASLHEELAQLVDVGLTAQEALAAATSRPADAFGLRDRGRIAVGKRADLLLVEGDPTRDILDSRRILTVWKNGFRVAFRGVDGPGGVC